MNIQADPTHIVAEADTQASPRWRDRLVGAVQIVVVVVVVAAAILFAREDGGARRFAGSAAHSINSAPLVQTMVPHASATRVTVTTTGSIATRALVELSAQVGGRIASVSPRLSAGGQFAAGEPLLQIEPRDFELALQQARADLAAAAANLELIEAESAAAIRNYALLNGQAPVPPLVAKRPQINQGRAQLDAARARVAIAELNLARTRFSLPFGGRVIEATAEVGQLVQPGQVFGRAYRIDARELVVPLPPVDVERLAPVIGRPAEVNVAGRGYPARVERMSADLDPQTRFARLYLRLEPTADLLPGTFVDVTLYGPELAAAFELPAAAEQGRGRVWVVDAGELRAVTPRLRYRKPASIVVDPFDAGDGVVIGAVPGAREGLAVRTEASGATSAAAPAP